MQTEESSPPPQTFKCQVCNALHAPSHLFCGTCGASLKPHIATLANSVLRAQLPLVLKDHLKDAALVEMEIAERALERVIKWAKYAAIVLSAPIVVLGFFGVKGFMDMSTTYEKISNQLASLEARTKTVGTQIDTAGARAEDLVRAGSKISSAYQVLEMKLEEYQQLSADLTALQRQVTNLETRIPPPRTNQFDAAVDVMARTIFGEARGIGREGMEAIAAVIANRANASATADQALFGKTIEEVCLKEHQFPSWNKGDPNRPVILNVKKTNPAFAEALKIARRTLLGELNDRTGGATYYHVAHLPTPPTWVKSVKPTLQIETHKFYRAFAPGEKH